MGEESACNAGDTGHAGLSPGLGRSAGEGKWQPIPVFLPVKSYRWRNPVGCSPKGLKESDVTELLSTYTLIHTTVYKIDKTTKTYSGAQGAALNIL